jgi:hypothetical protein
MIALDYYHRYALASQPAQHDHGMICRQRIYTGLIE